LFSANSISRTDRGSPIEALLDITYRQTALSSGFALHTGLPAAGESRGRHQGSVGPSLRWPLQGGLNYLHAHFHINTVVMGRRRDWPHLSVPVLLKMLGFAATSVPQFRVRLARPCRSRVRHFFFGPFFSIEGGRGLSGLFGTDGDSSRSRRSSRQIKTPTAEGLNDPDFAQIDF